MADKENLKVSGYRFGSYQDAGLADEELKKIEYFRKRVDGLTPQNLLAVYDRLLDEKIFKTPLGWEYLREIQGRLYKTGMPEDMVRPIPMYMTFSHDMEEDTEKSKVRQRIRPSRKKKNNNPLRVSVLLNIFLVILVLLMFVITLKSDNPNILNYKQTLTDRYATWEQELSQREQKIREKELELKMEP